LALVERVRRARGLAVAAARHRVSEAVRPRTARLRDLEFMRELVKRTDNFGDVTWLGHPVWQNVLDLWVIQEAISEIKPALLIECGTNRGGSALFFAHLFDLMDQGRVVSVDVERMHDLEHPRVEFHIGSSVSDEMLGRMRQAAAAADGPVMVILDSDHSAEHVAKELDAYHGFVTPGSLMLCQDGVIDELPMLARDRPGPLVAIKQFLAQHPEFHVDERYDRRFVVTHHPQGWLRRSR
jgi:cephalosporin hydroxylase